QQDNLCAQYALNSLLQGNYFTAVDLAEIAQQLDNEEQLVGGKKIDAESQNYDDSGYFSIQVLQKALDIWNLELIPWHEQIAYICNLSNHWFTLRNFSGNKSGSPHWYNLDSTQPGPTFIDDRYLPHLLQQIEHDGYSVFVVKGVLP
ncbi:Machado-joseph disease protein MJD, partial [Mycotypha africana]|uniref:Machado-joseph disease protein MJD n=1 Tax=Mycotypha africana TaxID=64632 RepID=UPI0022FFCC16